MIKFQDKTIKLEFQDKIIKLEFQDKTIKLESDNLQSIEVWNSQRGFNNMHCKLSRNKVTFYTFKFFHLDLFIKIFNTIVQKNSKLFLKAYCFTLYIFCDRTFIVTETSFCDRISICCRKIIWFLFSMIFLIISIILIIKDKRNPEFSMKVILGIHG